MLRADCSPHDRVSSLDERAVSIANWSINPGSPHTAPHDDRSRPGFHFVALSSIPAQRGSNILLLRIRTASYYVDPSYPLPSSILVVLHHRQDSRYSYYAYYLLVRTCNKQRGRTKIPREIVLARYPSSLRSTYSYSFIGVLIYV
jgi:hypothetical protein